MVSAPRHYQWQSRLWSYGPYAKEIDLWAALFDEVRIAGPWLSEPPPKDAVAFSAQNITPAPVTETGGDTLVEKLKQILLLPVVIFQLSSHIRASDAVHVRGPANLSLLSSIIARFLGRPTCAKYAGQWSHYPGERRLVTFQRFLLRKWFRGPVTVYGRHPADPPHIVDFFTAMLTREQIASALEATQSKRLHNPLRLVFAGRLYHGKGVLELINAVDRLSKSAPVELRIVGDGPLYEAAQQLVGERGLEEAVTFMGAMSHDQTLRQFAWADALVLASKHEGWPKVLTEAMVHHCLCIAPTTGLMGTMIAGRGCRLGGLSARHIAEAVRKVQADHSSYEARLPIAAAWAAQHSTEGLQEAIKQLLEARWNATLR